MRQWFIDEIGVQFILYSLWADAAKSNLAFPSHLDTNKLSGCAEAKFSVKETCWGLVLIEIELVWMNKI